MYSFAIRLAVCGERSGACRPPASSHRARGQLSPRRSQPNEPHQAPICRRGARLSAEEVGEQRGQEEVQQHDQQHGAHTCNNGSYVFSVTEPTNLYKIKYDCLR
jgi:hypothetical protein